MSSCLSCAAATSSADSLVGNPGASATTRYGPTGSAAENRPAASDLASKLSGPMNFTDACRPVPLSSETLPRTFPVATFGVSVTAARSTGCPATTLVETLLGS